MDSQRSFLSDFCDLGDHANVSERDLGIGQVAHIGHHNEGLIEVNKRRGVQEKNDSGVKTQAYDRKGQTQKKNKWCLGKEETSSILSSTSQPRSNPKHGRIVWRRIEMSKKTSFDSMRGLIILWLPYSTRNHVPFFFFFYTKPSIFSHWYIFHIRNISYDRIRQCIYGFGLLLFYKGKNKISTNWWKTLCVRTPQRGQKKSFKVEEWSSFAVHSWGIHKREKEWI